jgi:predicted enzyme related to lactoylglutathione lyase
MTSIGNHQVGHSEIPADNVDNLKNFYSSLFGWQFEGGETQGYFMIKNAGISGAIAQKDPQQISNQIVTVESIEGQFIRTLSLYSFCRFLC